MGAENPAARPHQGIGQSIGRLVAAFVLAAAFLSSLVLGYRQTLNDISERRYSLERMAYVLAASTADALAAKDHQQALNSLRAVGRMESVTSVVLVDATGKLVAQIGQSAFLTDNLSTADSSNLDVVLKGTLASAVDVVKAGKVVGRLVMLTDVSEVRDEAMGNMLMALVVSIFAAMLAVGASRPLQQRIVRPIIALAYAMAQIADSRDFGRTIKITATNREVDGLVASFNGLLADIRERDQSLQKLAYFDNLTGLANRVRLNETLQRWISVCQPQVPTGVVMLFNVPGFRGINDSFGHATGDATLLKVTELLLRNSSANSTVARIGGDEFAVLDTDVRTHEEAERAVARIQSAFYAPLPVKDIVLNVALTAGAVLLPVPGHTAESAGNEPGNTTSAIMRCADLALHAAKRAGPGRAKFFRQEMWESLRAETEMGQALRVALGNGGLQVHYQPQYEYRSGRITGFEALARWQDEKLGVISPSDFIPVAERNGLIAQLGEWVLRESCRQAKSWLDAGHEARTVSVNVSPAQLLEAGFVADVRSALNESGLPAKLLCLELTESLFLGPSINQVTATLSELASLGVVLALDDFGTGYSSLGYLSRLPFHVLKVDRSFVQAADSSPRRSEILRSIIVMAHSLGMGVVAEGAETEAESELLRKLGADKVQGFHVARPMPMAEALRHADAYGKPVPQLALQSA